MLLCREDICQSKVEVTTPFWAQNSDGQLRAILNNKEFEQAVHQEICTLVARSQEVLEKYLFSCSEHHQHSAVAGTVPVSRSTSGTDCWPTILTTTVPASSWTGSSSPPAVPAGQQYSSQLLKNKLLCLGATRIHSWDENDTSAVL